MLTRLLRRLLERVVRPTSLAGRLALSPDAEPADAEGYCRRALALDDEGRTEEAKAMLRKAIALDPRNPGLRTNLRILSARGVPMWHFSMMNDAARNSAYEQALRAVVRPGSCVLEIGTGSGLVAMMAARAGARQVVSCEMVPALAQKAREIVERNGFADRVTVIGRNSTELRVPGDLPEPADVLVSEIVASDLIGEGLLETFEDARRLLRPGAAVIPAAAEVRGQLVSAEGLDEFVAAGNVRGLDLSAFNEFRPLKVHAGEVGAEFVAMSPELELFRFDLQGRDHFPAEQRALDVPVTRTGRCVGLLQWVRLRLADEIAFENSPRDGLRRAGHWQQVLHLFDSARDFREGDAARLVAHHNRRNLVFYLAA